MCGAEYPYNDERGTIMAMTRRNFLKVTGASAAVAGLGLVGCSGETESASSGSKLDAIKERGTLACGVKADVLGYGYLNTETNEYEGLEIDLCYQVAAAVLGVSYEEAKEQGLCEFTTVTPKTRGPLIDNDTLDIVCATYTITPEREEDWDFSTPYRTDSVGIMVMANSGITTMADLDGKIIGVSQGSTTKDMVTQMLADQGVDATPTFNEYPDYPSINSALEGGQIDAFAMDRSTLNTYMNDNKELVQPEIEFGTQDYGIATKKDSDLSQVVDDTVSELLESGWIDEEIETWGLV